MSTADVNDTRRQGSRALESCHFWVIMRESSANKMWRNLKKKRMNETGMNEFEEEVARILCALGNFCAGVNYH